ncbi:MAG: CAL67264 family membrane protein [Salinimicrobium sp.]
MGMNKNGICAWTSFIMLLIGIALVLLGVLKYREYAIGFSTVGIGFFVMSWAFNALKGRV